MTNNYVEPDHVPNTAAPVNVLFEKHGKSLWRDEYELPPRPKEDILRFKPSNEEELWQNLVWDQCPPQHQWRIVAILKKWWDCNAEKGLCRPI